MSLAICSLGLNLEEEVPGSLEQSYLGKGDSASAEVLCPSETLSLGFLHIGIGREAYQVNGSNLAEELIWIASDEVIVLVVKPSALAFTGKVSLIVEAVEVPGIKLGALERKTASGLVWVLWIVLFKLGFKVICLHHLRGLYIEVGVLLFARLIVLRLMGYECPETDPSGPKKLVEFKLQECGGIKRYCRYWLCRFHVQYLSFRPL